MTLYFICLPTTRTPQFGINDVYYLLQHIPVFVEVRQQELTLADRNTCMCCAARYSLSGAKKSSGRKLYRRKKGQFMFLTLFPHVLMGLEISKRK